MSEGQRYVHHGEQNTEHDNLRYVDAKDKGREDETENTVEAGAGINNGRCAANRNSK